jgi:hypothetical protein
MGCFSGPSQKSSSFIPVQKTGLTEAINLYLQQLGQNNNVYQGQRVAPLTGLQTGAIDNAGNFLSTFSTPATTDTPLRAETGNALADILAGKTGAQKMTPADVEAFFKGTIQDPTMKNLTQTTLPLTDEGYTGGNFWNAARGASRDRAIQDTNDTLATARTGLNFNVLQANQGIDEAKAARTLAAVPQGMAFSQMPAQDTLNNLRIAATQLGGLNDLFGIGSAEQTQQQREIEASIVKFAEEHQITDPTNMAILLQLLTSNMSSGSSTGAGLGYTGVSAFMGGIGSGLGSGMMTPAAKKP